MDTQEEINNQFDRYLNKKMSATERIDFEQILATDELLKEELAEYQLFQPFKEATANLQTEGFFEASNKETASPSLKKVVQPTAKVFSIKRVLAVAASIALLGIVAYSLWPTGNNFNTQLAQSYNERSIAKTSGQGAASINIAVLKKMNPNELGVQDYIDWAVEDIKQGNDGMTTHQRLQNIANPSVNDQPTINWLSALALLHAGDKTKATQLLNDLRNNSDYGTYAKNLLEALE